MIKIEYIGVNTYDGSQGGGLCCVGKLGKIEDCHNKIAHDLYIISDKPMIKLHTSVCDICYSKLKRFQVKEKNQ